MGNENRIGMDRRSFLKGAAVTGAVAAASGLMGCGSPATESTETASSEYLNAEVASQKWEFEIAPDQIADSEITETYTADIIIIGAGVSGMTCAAAATEDGADVILFAASSVPVSRGGSNHGINTKAQQRVGITYTEEMMGAHIKKEMSSGSYGPDARKWFKWVNNSTESMNWLIDIMEGAGYETTLEVGFDDPDGIFTSTPASHNFIGGDVTFGAAFGQGLVMSTLEAKVLDQGGTIHYSTVAQYLIREDDNTGRVSAVIAKNADGEYVKYVGNKAVIMATGDFSGNKEMMSKYSPWTVPILADVEVDYDAQFQFGGLFPGDGQRMGLWIGAAWQRNFPNAPMIDALGPAPYTRSIANHTGINLNKEGVRFMNEDTICSYSALAAMKQTDMTVYYIWDAEYVNAFDIWNTFGVTLDSDNGPKGMSPADQLAAWEASVEDGTFVKADTIEEALAGLDGIDAAAAKASVDRYNEMCAAGVDDDYRKNAEFLSPIKTGPFYACKNTIGPANFLCVTGGLRTNTDMQVCEDDDTPIEGLYNIGIMVGDMYANCYNFSICGHNLGATCNTFSYMLGKELANA